MPFDAVTAVPVARGAVAADEMDAEGLRVGLGDFTGLAEPVANPAPGLSIRERVAGELGGCRDAAAVPVLGPPSAGAPRDFRAVVVDGFVVAGAAAVARIDGCRLAAKVVLGAAAIDVLLDALAKLSFELAGVPANDALFAVAGARLGLDPRAPAATTPEGRGFVDGGPIGRPFADVGALTGERGACGAGGASSTTLTTPVGRINRPNPGSQSKYRSPCTEPSFLPVASSSSTPTQSPV